MTSTASDAMLKAVLEDDRIGLPCEAIEDAMSEEQGWLEGVPHYTWARLAALVPETGTSPSDLRSSCLQYFHLARGFIQKKVTIVAKGYPWKLLHGDRVANLKNLINNEDTVEDEVTAKIKTLVKANYNMDRPIARWLGEAGRY